MTSRMGYLLEQLVVLLCLISSKTTWSISDTEEDTDRDMDMNEVVDTNGVNANENSKFNVVKPEVLSKILKYISRSTTVTLPSLETSTTTNDTSDAEVNSENKPHENLSALLNLTNGNLERLSSNSTNATSEANRTVEGVSSTWSSSENSTTYNASKFFSENSTAESPNSSIDTNKEFRFDILLYDLNKNTFEILPNATNDTSEIFPVSINTTTSESLPNFASNLSEVVSNETEDVLELSANSTVNVSEPLSNSTSNTTEFIKADVRNYILSPQPQEQAQNESSVKKPESSRYFSRIGRRFRYLRRGYKCGPVKARISPFQYCVDIGCEVGEKCTVGNGICCRHFTRRGIISCCLADVIMTHGYKEV